MLGLGINISKYQAPSGGLPLDTVPGAVAAYSLRELTTAWKNQPVIELRRNADDTFRSFTAAEVLNEDTVTWTKGIEPSTLTLPADYGSGAEAAYSLRYVKASYELAASPVIRVRRTSDNAESDFTPAEIIDGTMETWVGVNNGNVTTWYDQSGNSHDVTQTSASSQPQIIISGVLQKLNGKPSLNTASSRYMTTASTTTMLQTPDFSVFSVCAERASTLSGVVVAGGTGTTNQARFIFQQLNHMAIGYNGFNSATSLPSLGGGSVQGLMTWICTDQTTGSTATTVGTTRIVNSSSFSSSSVVTCSVPDIFGIGANHYASSSYFNDHMQEIIIYHDDQTINQTNIELNMNAYYEAILHNSLVSTWYDQSGNGNNLVQTNNNFRPRLVLSGTQFTENGLPTIWFEAATTDYLQTSSVLISGTTHRSIIAVAKADPVGANEPIIALTNKVGPASGEAYNFTPESALRVTGNNLWTDDPMDTNLSLGTLIFNGTEVTDTNFYKDGILITPVSSTPATINTDSTTYTSVGGHVGRAFLNGYISELMLWDFDLASDRNKVEPNILQYYSI